MCVIFIAYKERPSENMIQAAWDQNSHGGGLAFREGKSVRFMKGLSLEDMKEHMKDLPMPFVAHFRIASCGGIIPALTHPFPITPQMSLDLDGNAPSVLFHNGHWQHWKTNLLDIAVKSGHKLRAGEPWSDSRAMAFIALKAGEGFLDLIDEKVVTLGTRTLNVFGSGWKEINGVYCSNDFFDARLKRLDRGEASDAVIHRAAPYHLSPPASLPGGPVSVNPPVTSLVPRAGGPASGEVSSTNPFVQGEPVTLSAKALRRIRRRAEKRMRKEEAALRKSRD